MDQSHPAQSAGSSPPVLQPPGQGARILQFGLSHGGHKFILGSVDFQDESGNVVYSATRESALHENYTIVQGETTLLHMRHKTHFNAYSFELQDASGAPIGEIQCHFTRMKGQLPSYSYTDQQGNQKAVVAWEQRTLRYAICDPASALVFAQASVEFPGGAMADLKALVHGRGRMAVAEGSPLALPILLAFGVTLANMPPL